MQQKTQFLVLIFAYVWGRGQTGQPTTSSSRSFFSTALLMTAFFPDVAFFDSMTPPASSGIF
jgi:hypothetical protein